MAQIFKTDRFWPGRLRLVALFPVGNFFLSIIVLALSVVYVKQITRAELSEWHLNYSNLKQVSLNEAGPYTLIMPVFTLVQSAGDLVLLFSDKFHPTYALCASVVFMIAWITQSIFWMSCEGMYESGVISCLTDRLKRKSEGYNIFPGQDEAASKFKDVLGALLAVSYAVIVCFAAAAVHRARMAKKANTVRREKQLSPSSSLA